MRKVFILSLLALGLIFSCFDGNPTASDSGDDDVEEKLIDSNLLGEWICEPFFRDVDTANVVENNVEYSFTSTGYTRKLTYLSISDTGGVYWDMQEKGTWYVNGNVLYLGRLYRDRTYKVDSAGRITDTLMYGKEFSSKPTVSENEYKVFEETRIGIVLNGEWRYYLRK